METWRALPKAGRGAGKAVALANEGNRWGERRATTRNERESEVVALLIKVARSFDEFISSLCLRVFLSVSCFVFLVLPCSLFPKMADCVLYFACPWLNNTDLCQMCAVSTWSVREEERSVGAENTACLRACQRKLLQCRKRHRRVVVRAQLRLL